MDPIRPSLLFFSFFLFSSSALACCCRLMTILLCSWPTSIQIYVHICNVNLNIGTVVKRQRSGLGQLTGPQDFCL
jgi:hypothetical protein